MFTMSKTGYELLVKGGTLLDPGRAIHERRDIAFADQKVVAEGPDLDAGAARAVVDATGKTVTPGLIDLHVHVFPGVSHFGIEPDATCLARGATTVLDAYITPVLKKFILRVSSAMPNANLKLMTSAGGIISSTGFNIGTETTEYFLDDDGACNLRIYSLFLSILSSNLIFYCGPALQNLVQFRGFYLFVYAQPKCHSLKSWCQIFCRHLMF